MATNETKILTAHLPASLAEKVDQLALRLERSHGWIVEQTLGAWVDLEEERSHLTREAMSDIDAGRVVDHESVLERVDSIGHEMPLAPPEPS